jgi:hypothetical protein
MEKVSRGFETYKRCIDSGIWPGQGFDWDSMDYQTQMIGDEGEPRIYTEDDSI